MQVRERLRTRAAAFRSKSRGLHVYVFVDEPISARQMHEYLVALRKRLPRACFDKKARRDVEVFPKATQTVVTPDNEAAFLPRENGGEDVITAILPMLVDDGSVFYASTPAGKNNFFAGLFLNAKPDDGIHRIVVRGTEVPRMAAKVERLRQQLRDIARGRVDEHGQKACHATLRTSGAGTRHSTPSAVAMARPTRKAGVTSRPKSSRWGLPMR